MRVITVNVNGIHQAAQRGFYDWLMKQRADVVCVQDIRCKAYEMDDPIFNPEGFDLYIFDSEQDNHGGVALYYRRPPKAIMTGFAYEMADREGRFLQADYEKVSIASVLFPTPSESPNKRYEFLEAFLDHLKKTRRKRREFIFCGSFYVAHQTFDVDNWKLHQGKPGFSPEDREWMDQVFGPVGFADAFRELNYEENQFTWWPEGKINRSGKDGWRVDFQIVTPGVKRYINSAIIDNTLNVSQHLPVIIDYDMHI